MTFVTGSTERGRAAPTGIAALGGAARGRARQAPGERAADSDDVWAVRVEIVQRRPSQAPAEQSDVIDVQAEPVPTPLPPRPRQAQQPETRSAEPSAAGVPFGFEAPDARRAADAYRVQAAWAGAVASTATLGLRVRA